MNHFGAFSRLTPEDYELISSGFRRTNPINVGGIGIPERDVASNLFSLAARAAGASTPFGLIPSAASVYKSYGQEQAASRAMGQDPSFANTVAGMVGGGNFDAARSAADTNNDGTVTINEARAFGIGSGLSASDVGVNVNFGSSERDGGFGKVTGSGLVSPETFDIGSSLNQFNTPTTMPPLQSPEPLGQSEPEEQEPEKRTNVKGTVGYDPEFAKEITQQRQSGGGGGGKYICTALHEIGDMSSQVFAYDMLYGQLVNPVVHSGYSLWGIPLAKKVKEKGLIYKIVKPLALAWANQMSYELSGGDVGNKSLTGLLLVSVGEKICYQIGLLRRVKWQMST